MPSRRHQPGQVLVFFALALTGILAMVGISIDVGNIYLQRRIAQTAADAAALAGVRCLYLQATAPLSAERCRPTDADYATPTALLPLDMKDAIEYWVWKNSSGVLSKPEEMVWVRYDASSGSTYETPIDDLNKLAATSPSDASGVRVIARREYPPYLLQVVTSIVDLPASIATSNGELIARSAARAQVGVVTAVAGDLAPLAACGDDMVQAGGVLHADLVLGTGLAGDPYRLNTAYYGTEFILQWSQLDQETNDLLCPHTSGASWKGRTDEEDDISGDQDISLNNGEPSAAADVACVQSGQPAPAKTSPSPCRLILPLVKRGPSNDLATVQILACFEMLGDLGGSKNWQGILREDCPPYGTMGFTWTKSAGAQLTRLMLTD